MATESISVIDLNEVRSITLFKTDQSGHIYDVTLFINYKDGKSTSHKLDCTSKKYDYYKEVLKKIHSDKFETSTLLIES